MSVATAWWHVAGLFALPLALGALAAGFAKAVFRRKLAGVRWWSLAWPAAAAAAAADVVGLVVFARDGRIATWAAMVLACAAALWWRGFTPAAARRAANAAELR